MILSRYEQEHKLTNNLLKKIYSFMLLLYAIIVVHINTRNKKNCIYIYRPNIKAYRESRNGTKYQNHGAAM